MDTKEIVEQLVSALQAEIDLGKDEVDTLSQRSSVPRALLDEADGAMFESGVDLATLLGEMTAIKAALRKETEAFRQTRDGLQRALQTLERELERSRQRENKLREEISQMGAQTSKEVALSLIDIFDRLEPAVEACQAEGDKKEGGKAWWSHLLTRWSLRVSKNGEALQRGITLTLENIDTRLSELGVCRMEVVNKPFDPHRMCAVDTTNDGQTPEGVVTRQVRCGYMMNDQALRPAQVVVNRKV